MSRYRKHGFTLIEMAIVLVIIGIVMAGSFAGIKPILDSSRTAATTSRLQRVELALLAYVIQNGCLPCPANGALASSDGNAGWSFSSTAAPDDYYGPNGPDSRPCSGTGCSAVRGVVPWNTLGMREADIIDAWSDRITYAVTGSLTTTAGTSMVRTEPASYPAGTLTVTNNDSTPVTQTSVAAYVLVSHGKDRAFAFAAGSGADVTVGNTTSTSQDDNDPGGTPNGTTFIQDVRVYPQEGAGYFDDIVSYRTAPNLIQDCGVNACGNPS